MQESSDAESAVLHTVSYEDLDLANCVVMECRPFGRVVLTV
jgi:hypothetical protein